MRRLEALISLVFIRVHSWLKDLFSVSLGLCAACPVWGRNTAPIEVGTREGTLPLPPNRTGGSPASGFPVSGFVVLRWSASTGGLLPRTAAHRAQTIHGASGGAPPPTPAGFGLAAFPAGSSIVASRSHPRSQTHSPGCAGSIHTSRATPGSLPSRWPRSSARSVRAPALSTSSGSSPAAISGRARSDTRGEVKASLARSHSPRASCRGCRVSPASSLLRTL